MRNFPPYRLGLIVFVATAVLFLFDVFESAELRLADARFKALETEAPLSLVVVAIDPASISEVGVWPWPRRHHATVLDKLIEAGAKRIAFDIDFSSASTPEDDRLLESALAKAGHQVILPIFKQYGETGDGGQVIVETMPLERFGRHTALASINARPDLDGIVRRMNRRENMANLLVPSMAHALTDQPSETLDNGTYYLDYGISPGGIPRLSFVDVLNGRFDPARIAGKKVIIGATAIELGDQLPVPVYRSLPGVMVQSLAYASLMTDRALDRLPLAFTLLAALAISLLLMPYFCAWRWPRGLALAGGSIAVLAIGGIAVQYFMPVIVDIVPLMFAVIVGFVTALISGLDKQALKIFKSDMQYRKLAAIGDIVLESGGHAVVIVDHEQRIQVFNPAAEEMFGVDAKDIKGRTFARLFTGDDGGFRGDLLNPFITDALNSDAREFEAVRSDGSRFFVEAIVKRIDELPSEHRLERRVDTRSTYICTLFDVTRRKEIALSEHLLRLQAQSENRTKSEFLSNMSHELRTPLNAILGFSQIIQSELVGDVNERHKTYIADILDSGYHLLNLINDILDLSKIEADKLEIQLSPVDTPSLIERAVKFVESSAAKGRVSLRIDVSGVASEANLDERAIKQVLINLLGNAVKFTPPGGEVRIVAENLDNGDVKFVIRDTGIGIRQSDLENVFLPFTQARHGQEGNVEGTGLGLTLSRRLVEMHSGTLTLESEVGAGTVVTVTLPQVGGTDDDESSKTIH